MALVVTKSRWFAIDECTDKIHDRKLFFKERSVEREDFQNGAAAAPQAAPFGTNEGHPMEVNFGEVYSPAPQSGSTLLGGASKRM